MESGDQKVTTDLIYAELRSRLRVLQAEIENTDRRDPFLHELYSQRRQLRATIQSLNDQVAWESEMAVLSRSMPEQYGGW
jgi:hypothetical protein